MPIRLILFLIIAGILIVFAGFNAGNTSDISFGFTTIHDVPIFVSLFAAFALGIIFTLPLITVARFKRRKSRKESSKDKQDPPRITSGGSRDKNPNQTKTSDSGSKT